MEKTETDQLLEQLRELDCELDKLLTSTKDSSLSQAMKLYLGNEHDATAEAMDVDEPTKSDEGAKRSKWQGLLLVQYWQSEELLHKPILAELEALKKLNTQQAQQVEGTKETEAAWRAKICSSIISISDPHVKPC